MIWATIKAFSLVSIGLICIFIMSSVKTGGYRKKREKPPSDVPNGDDSDSEE